MLLIFVSCNWFSLYWMYLIAYLIVEMSFAFVYMNCKLCIICITYLIPCRSFCFKLLIFKIQSRGIQLLFYSNVFQISYHSVIHKIRKTYLFSINKPGVQAFLSGFVIIFGCEYKPRGIKSRDIHILASLEILSPIPIRQWLFRFWNCVIFYTLDQRGTV